jgi:hypothetical protein
LAKRTILLGKQKCGISCRLSDARIIVGLKKIQMQMNMLENLQANFTFYLDSVNVKEGDAFF